MERKKSSHLITHDPRRDRLFLDPDRDLTQFSFDQDVAAVFDDMLERSIPYYRDLQQLIARFSSHFVKPNSVLYDLGCSTGTTLKEIINITKAQQTHYLGVDLSRPMIEKARASLSSDFPDESVTLMTHDLNNPLIFKAPCYFMSLILSLQFTAIQRRLPLLNNIYKSLEPGGALVLVEKIHLETPLLESLYTREYHHFKEDNGYSPLEINRKQRALKQTLLPLSLTQNTQLLMDAGFSTITPFYQWLNFAGLIAIKGT